MARTLHILELATPLGGVARWQLDAGTYFVLKLCNIAAEIGALDGDTDDDPAFRHVAVDLRRAFQYMNAGQILKRAARSVGRQDHDVLDVFNIAAIRGGQSNDGLEASFAFIDLGCA